MSTVGDEWVEKGDPEVTITVELPGVHRALQALHCCQEILTRQWWADDFTCYNLTPDERKRIISWLAAEFGSSP
jgi:hypothetical protein